MQNNTMPAGRYYVGDLCYVMHDHWDEFCNLTLSEKNPDQNKFSLKNGVVFCSLDTAYGDGVYSDHEGRSYPVDAGLIGCIKVDNITDDKADLNLGNIIEFEQDFECYSDISGNLYFGEVCIETGDEEDDDFDDEDK